MASGPLADLIVVFTPRQVRTTSPAKLALSAESIFDHGGRPCDQLRSQLVRLRS